MMQSKALECPICYQEYDLEQRIPMILVDCGHTICQYCLKHLIEANDSKCPLDKKVFKRKEMSSFPVNFSLKGVIEENLEWDRCKQDGEKIEFICKTDRCKVCLQCWHHDKHQGHDIILLETLKTEFENKRQELENTLKMINDYSQAIEEFLHFKKAYLEEQIAEIFGQKEMQIQYRQVSLLFDLIHYTNYEKRRLVCTLNYGFNLKHDIVGKLNYLNEIQSKTPWNIFEESVTELTLRGQKVLERRNYEKIIQKRLSEVENHFESLISASQNQEEANFNAGYLNLISWFHERCPEEEEHDSTTLLFEIKTSPELTLCSSPFPHIGLLIKTSTKNQNAKHTIDLQAWKEENALTLVFEGNSRITDLEMIYLLRWHLKHIKTINLVLNNINKGMLFNIISIFYLLLDKVDRIFLVVHCQIRTNLDDLFLLLKDKIIQKISSRTNLCFYFECVETSTAAFKNLIKTLRKYWASQFSFQKEDNITKIEVGSSSKDRDLNNLLSLIPERRSWNFIQSYGYPYYYTDLLVDYEYDDDQYLIEDYVDYEI